MRSDLRFVIVVAVGILLLLAYYAGVLTTQWRNRSSEKLARKDATRRSRAVLTGQFCEQLAPYLPNFPYKPTEVRFVGKPVDYIVFEGLDEKSISRVVFLEVKSGNASLNNSERSLREAVASGRVAFELYHAPCYPVRGETVGG